MSLTTRKIDNWRFWMLIAYAGISLLVVGLFIAIHKTNSEEAKRLASGRATEIQAVTTCFAAVQNAPIVAGFIASHRALIENSIDANRALLKTKGESVSVIRIRRASLVRLAAAMKNVDDLERTIKEMTPSRKSCIRLAVRAHVSFKKFLRKPSQP